MDQFQVTPDLQKQREEADKSAYVKALMGPVTPENMPYNSFAEHFAGSAQPLYRNDTMLTQPNSMLSPLVQLGLQKRQQGTWPPAQHPGMYDFKK